MRTPARSALVSAVAFVSLLGLSVDGPPWGVARMAGQTPPPASGLPSTQSGEWPSYNADIKGTRYSPLSQIDASNFSKLEVAWRFKTDNLGPFPEYKLEGTPLMVKGVLYTTAGTRRSVIALDATTGELMWAHSIREGKCLTGGEHFEDVFLSKAG